jgi:peptidoglycan/LPS O-acetylase OafA/YrhL
LILSYIFSDNFTFSKGYKYFLFSQNIFTPHPSWFPEAWSLSVEEWFYLVIPVVLFGLVGMGKVITNKAILWTSIMILILITGIRFYRYMEIPVHSMEDWDLLFRKQVLTRLDSLMFGLIGAYMFYYHKEGWVRYKGVLLVLGIAIFLVMKYLDRYNLNGLGIYQCVLSFSLTSLATLMLLPFLSQVKSGSGVAYKAITYISLISYSMYLLHLSVIHDYIIASLNFTEWPVYIKIAARYLLYWTITIISSILLYKYFETPVMKLRERFS